MRKQLIAVGILSTCVSVSACGSYITDKEQETETITVLETAETEQGKIEAQQTEIETQEIELSQMEQQIEEFKNSTPSEITETQDVLRGQWRIGDMLTLVGDAYYEEPFRLGNLRIDYDTSSKKSNVIFTNNEFIASYDDARVHIVGDKSKNMQCTFVVSGLYRVVSQESINEENDYFSSEIELLITDVSVQSDATDAEVCEELNWAIGTTIQKEIEFSEMYCDLSYLTEEQLAEYDMEIHDISRWSTTRCFIC